MTTHDVVHGCKRPLLAPLKRMTGIHSRRVASESEFSIDLARRAIERCLQDVPAGDTIDLIIAANISKYDAKFEYHLDPSTATQLRVDFGLTDALAIDLSNACAGTFSAIKVADHLIAGGIANRALIVSGEYITHLITTAQNEIRGIKDPRMACLTLGDAGVALLLEKRESESKGSGGFAALDMYTVPQHAQLCLAHESDLAGSIMLTDAVGLANASMHDAGPHFATLLKGGHFPVTEDMRLITHQTSSNSVKQAARVVNQAAGERIMTSKQIVDNLYNRGNTATTSHWVAIQDLLDKGELHAGQSVMFAVQASGVTVGAGHFFPDDLIKLQETRKAAVKAGTANIAARAAAPEGTDSEPTTYYRTIPEGQRVVIGSVGLSNMPGGKAGKGKPVETVDLAADAAQRAISDAGAGGKYLSYFIHCGIYREKFMSEPALATLITHKMGIKGSIFEVLDKRIFAFDIINGFCAPLQACMIGGRMLRDRGDIIIISSAEYPHMALPQKKPMGIANVGSAMMMEKSAGARGFREFAFYTYPEHRGAFRTYCDMEKQPVMHLEVDGAYENTLRECITASVRKLLEHENMSIGDFAHIIPPQVSQKFSSDLTGDLNATAGQMVVCEQENLATSSLPAAWSKLTGAAGGGPKPGQQTLCISASAGINVSCAIYVH